ncbi:MAG: hypothetical protein WKF84_03175 [Pyrinomonadaceae bacterium]
MAAAAASGSRSRDGGRRPQTSGGGGDRRPTVNPAAEAPEAVFLEEEIGGRTAQLEESETAIEEIARGYLDFEDDDQPELSHQQVREMATLARFGEEPTDTPFAQQAANLFQRIEDDEFAAEDGSMLKDAMIQERITDRIRAVDFDIAQAPREEDPFFTDAGRWLLPAN